MIRLTREERNKMATVLNKKLADLKRKIDKLTEHTPVLKGKDNMVELDPNNEQHREWFEVDEYNRDK